MGGFTEQAKLDMERYKMKKDRENWGDDKTEDKQYWHGKRVNEERKQQRRNKC